MSQFPQNSNIIDEGASPQDNTKNQPLTNYEAQGLESVETPPDDQFATGRPGEDMRDIDRYVKDHTTATGATTNTPGSIRGSEDIDDALWEAEVYDTDESLGSAGGYSAAPGQLDEFLDDATLAVDEEYTWRDPGDILGM